jgi:hypothetical protein
VQDLPSRIDISPATDGATRAGRMVMHESQQIAAEHRDLAAHAHRAGAEHLDLPPILRQMVKTHF